MSRRIFDESTAVTLRNIADGSETATAAETGVAFNPDNFEQVAVVIRVSAVDATTGDETYVFSVESDTAAAETNNVVQAQLPNIRAIGTGYYTMIVDCETLKKLDSDAAFLRIKATLGGTTPIITYGAWLMPIKGGA